MTDLSPRHGLAWPEASSDERARARRLLHRRRRSVIAVAVVVVVLVGGFVMVQGLRNATLFFRNVDEAVAQRDDLGERRFRIQGRAIPASVDSDGGVTVFELMHGCTVAAVRHLGDPPELFESPWIPVVLEGRWAPGRVGTVAGDDTHYFLSDRMLVKHTNEYSAANVRRVAPTRPAGFGDGCAFELPEA